MEYDTVEPDSDTASSSSASAGAGSSDEWLSFLLFAFGPAILGAGSMFPAARANVFRIENYHIQLASRDM